MPTASQLERKVLTNVANRLERITPILEIRRSSDFEGLVLAYYKRQESAAVQQGDSRIRLIASDRLIMPRMEFKQGSFANALVTGQRVDDVYEMLSALLRPFIPQGSTGAIRGTEDIGEIRIAKHLLKYLAEDIKRNPSGYSATPLPMAGT